MDNYKGIKKCNCGRPWCEFFAPGIGDGGRSFSKEDLKNLPKEIKEDIKEAKEGLKEVIKLIKTTK